MNIFTLQDRTGWATSVSAAEPYLAVALTGSGTEKVKMLKASKRAV